VKVLAKRKELKIRNTKIRKNWKMLAFVKEVTKKPKIFTKVQED
jgi:hypothetical protein